MASCYPHCQCGQHTASFLFLTNLPTLAWDKLERKKERSALELPEKQWHEAENKRISPSPLAPAPTPERKTRLRRTTPAAYHAVPPPGEEGAGSSGDGEGGAETAPQKEKPAVAEKPTEGVATDVPLSTVDSDSSSMVANLPKPAPRRQ